MTDIENSEDYVYSRCPVCNSDKVSVCVNEKGYFEVISCSKCGYKKG